MLGYRPTTPRSRRRGDRAQFDDVLFGHLLTTAYAKTRKELGNPRGGSLEASYVVEIVFTRGPKTPKIHYFETKEDC